MLQRDLFLYHPGVVRVTGGRACERFARKAAAGVESEEPHLLSLLTPAEMKNTLFLGDCLDAAARLPGGSLHLVYLDPPFATGKKREGVVLSLGPGGRTRVEGGGGEVLRFEDRRRGGLEAYLAWIEPRLRAMVRLLKPSGALVVHLDGNAVHYVKVMLDAILGRNRFVNEIVWHYRSGGAARRRLARKHDTLLWYSRGKTFFFDPSAAATPRNRCRLCGTELPRPNHMKRRKGPDGREILSIRSYGRVYAYPTDGPGVPSDVWLDIPHLQQRDPERTGYPAQKPLALLERVVRMCSREGDWVGDFFAGTGTTLLAAARLGRRWVGCDTSPEAIHLARARIDKEGFSCRVERIGRRGKETAGREGEA